MSNDNGNKKNLVLTRKHNSRLYFLIFIFVSAFTVIEANLFITQIVNHQVYVDKSKKQYCKKTTIFAPRGNIYDRNYKIMAENIGENYAFGINTAKVENKKDLAKRLAAITGQDYRDYEKALSPKSKFIWVARNITVLDREKILDVLTEKESSSASFKIMPNRVYPCSKIGGQVVGYVDIDGNGLSGIEKRFDLELTGQDGWEYIYKDAHQNKSYNYNIQKKEPQPGNSLVLTIDENYQAIVEEELESTVKQWSALKAMAIVLEPNSGEILAMSSYPNFDPNKAGDFPPETQKNMSITDMYEPGSTFKAVTAAMLLEENKVSEEDMFLCSNSGIVIVPGQKPIKDSHPNPIENMSFRQVIAKSSNVGTVKAAMRLNRAKFYEYVRSFGFGDRTDIGMTGESKGQLRKLSTWSVLTQPTTSFGQGISVTPLQIAMAYGTIANGGKLMKPMLIKGILDKDNNIVQKNEPVVIRQVISDKTAARTRSLLRGVFEEGGTAAKLEIPGLNLAGKTGTAQKVVGGLYSKSDYIGSFVGFFPADKPKLVCIVVIDSPRGEYYGGLVAGPAFKKIMERIYINNKAKLIVNSNSKDSTSQMIITPELTGLSFKEAEKVLVESKLSYRSIGKKGVVKFQSLPAYSLISPKDTIIISDRDLYRKKMNLIPNVTKQSLRTAVLEMHKAGVGVVVIGSGNVYDQSLKSGLKPESAVSCTLYCRPNQNIAAAVVKPAITSLPVVEAVVVPKVKVELPKAKIAKSKNKNITEASGKTKTKKLKKKKKNHEVI